MTNSPFRRTFIREWRKRSGMTLEDLGGAIGMTSSHLSMLERGQRGYTQETLEQIASALGATAGELLTGPPSKSGIVKIEAPEEVAAQLTAYRDGLLRGRGH